MKAFPNRGNLEQLRKTFTTGAETEDITSAELTSEWGFKDLKAMTPDQLADRMLQIDEQAVMLKWVIMMRIRDKFPSDREMGDFVNSIAKYNPEHPLCTITQQSRNRYIHAGRFITRHKITDLVKLKVTPTAVMEIAQPQYRDVADQVLADIRSKGFTVDQVIKKLKIAKAVNSGMDPVVAEEKIINPLPAVVKQPPKAMPPPVTQAYVFKPVVTQDEYPPRQTSGMDGVELTYEAFSLKEVRDEELLLELATRDASYASDGEIKENLLLFVERYQRSSKENEALFLSAAESMKALHSVA
jgi:hypothetical protein